MVITTKIRPLQGNGTAAISKKQLPISTKTQPESLKLILTSFVILPNPSDGFEASLEVGRYSKRSFEHRCCRIDLKHFIRK